MQYRKPHFYHDFACIAGKCPDTCCAGWQIVIDEESLDKYENVKGAFGTRLLNSIDWSEGVFEQYDKRCSFLNEENLCDLYKELGPEALCDTCRRYPRHVEEFENLRELSLSLSCPVAAEIILGCEKPVEFMEEEDDTEEIEEDYEEFDFLLFGQLEDAREILLNVIQDRSLSIEKRMILILKLADQFQKALDEGVLFELDLEEILERLKTEAFEPDKKARLESMKTMLKDLQKLEVLRDEWPDILGGLEENLYSRGEGFYQDAREEFAAKSEKDAGKKQQWEIYQEQLLVFFIYTYFCGAVYDDMVYTKTVLAVFSTLWIEELLFAKWLEQGKVLGFEDVVKVSYQYAREIEHSDENLIMLDEIFDENEQYQPDNLALAILK